MLSSSLASEKEVQLRTAAFRNKVDELIELLNQGVNINAKNTFSPSQRTPLHQAVANKSIACAKELLVRGASVDIKDGKGKTAIDYVLEKDDYELLELFKKYSKAVKKRLHEKIADYAILFIRTKYPYGGLNQVEVSESMPKYEYLDQALMMYQLRLLYGLDVSEENRKKIGSLLNELKGAYCGELSTMALHELTTKFPNVKFALLSSEIHTVLLVGAKKSRANNDFYKDPGYCEIVSDTWAKKKYYGQDFCANRLNYPNIKFFKRIHIQDNRIITDVEEQHYLTGNFKVIK